MVRPAACAAARRIGLKPRLLRQPLPDAGEVEERPAAEALPAPGRSIPSRLPERLRILRPGGAIDDDLLFGKSVAPSHRRRPCGSCPSCSHPSAATAKDRNRPRIARPRAGAHASFRPADADQEPARIEAERHARPSRPARQQAGRKHALSGRKHAPGSAGQPAFRRLRPHRPSGGESAPPPFPEPAPSAWPVPDPRSRAPGARSRSPPRSAVRRRP